MGFFRHILSAALVCGSIAAAQISFPLEDFHKALGASGTNFSYNKSKVKLEALDGLLYTVSYRGPASDYLSGGMVLAAAMGQKEIAQGFNNYLRQNALNLRGKGQVKLGVADGYDFRLELGAELSFSLGPEEVREFGRDHNVLGSKGVMIREFSDFECPFCQKLHKEIWAQLKKRFIESGQARFSYRHLPLFEIHLQAYPAALASECAALQGKFFEYHDGLFSKGLDYIARAREARLDMNRFQSCMAGAQTVPTVAEDFNITRKLGLNSTPTVFVGPFRLPNPYDLATYERYLRMAAALQQ